MTDPDTDRTTVPLSRSEAASEPLEPATSSLPTQLADDQVAIAWIVCAPLPPIPVGPGGVVRLGRGRGCDMVLPHESVSREHVVLRGVDGAIVATNRSNFGMHVNEKKVMDSLELAIGDEVWVGPYHLTVTGDAAPVAIDSALTRPFSVVAQSDDLQGRIRKVPLAEVLQQLEFNQRTGTLSVFSDDQEGSLVVYQGQPMHAQFGGLEDDEAVFTMIALTSGSFSLSSKVEAGERTISTSLTGLLLEARRREDESNSPS